MVFNPKPRKGFIEIKIEKLQPETVATFFMHTPKRVMQTTGGDQMDKRKQTNQWKPNDRHVHQMLDDRKLATCTNDD